MATATKKAPAKKAAAKEAPPAKKAMAKAAPMDPAAAAKKGGGSATKKAPAKKRTPSAAFMKPMTLSPALAAVIGDKPLARTEVTKKVWEYIKKNNLQDKEKRTMINADEKLRAVVDSAQISMFEMTKKISNHLK